jgi:CDGSH-type Zn-finger protein
MDPETTITVYPNGPLLVRGPFEMKGEDGTTIEVNRPIVALCRCGKSRIRPFCDGTHKQAGFRAEGALENRGRTGG